MSFETLTLYSVAILAVATAFLAGPIVGFTIYKLRQVLFGTLPPWHPEFQETRPPRALRILAIAVPMAIPWLMLLGFLLPFDLMPEDPDYPWYVPYTTAWALLAFLVFSPATSLVTLLGQLPFSPVAWTLWCCWALLLSGAVYAIARAWRRRDLLTRDPGAP